MENVKIPFFILRFLVFSPRSILRLFAVGGMPASASRLLSNSVVQTSYSDDPFPSVK